MIALSFDGFDQGRVQALIDLWVASWRKAYPDIDFDARRPWAAARLRELHDAGVDFLVARTAADDALAGFLTLDRRTGHIDQVVVGLEFQGQGVGDRMLALAKAQGPGRLTLDVNADNHAAIALYRRNGFVQTGQGVNPMSGRSTFSMAWTA